MAGQLITEKIDWSKFSLMCSFVVDQTKRRKSENESSIISNNLSSDVAFQISSDDAGWQSFSFASFVSMIFVNNP